jgi:hypothetical protein
MVGAVVFHVCYGLREIVDDTNRHDSILILCIPVLFFRPAKGMIAKGSELGVGPFVRADLHPARLKRRSGLSEECFGNP